ncbi:DUF2938 domain-containing protein [Rapidithrix thailandica]|uniref:DUF2938 domain-containing protein n=1 Tax=Rapidithrix thailandica TaxID=413964 RepID=A0AAW9SGN4_9BACT
METLIKTITIGIGATLTMDLWAIILKFLFNIKSLDYRFVGRWIGHFPKGKFFHESIAKAEPVMYELTIGWMAHYFIGISFALLLVGVFGESWLQKPTLVPALLIGILTVAAPFFIMQPGLGVGVAASNLPDPNIARLKSLITHTIFGLGLFLSAILLNSAWKAVKGI